MISRRTKIQLVIFAFITLFGVSYVGAHYARLDRIFFDDTYTVVAHYDNSGGIFAGAEVDWRGVAIGRVSKLVVTPDGVDVHLSIEKKFDKIPASTLALVNNRSAVGEQYVDLEPKVDSEPFLAEGTEIPMADTRTPILTQKFLGDISDTVESVNKDSLITVTHEFGKAFDGTGEALGRIIDTSNSFIETANANFDVTTALIKDSNTVLRTQADTASAIRSFAKNLALFSGSLAGSDKDLRAVIESGSATANQLRTFLDDNKVELASLVNNLVTTGQVVVKHIDGVRQILVVYPYVVRGGFTVVSKDPITGLYDAHFGMVMTSDPPVCHRGYESTDRRPPQDGSNRPMVMDAHCSDPTTNFRGAQHAPRVGAAYRSPVVATFDPETGKLRWTDSVPADLSSHDTLAPVGFGEDSWKWLFLQPLVSTEE
jgi:phospholipid/cholesterol/gamma-HCH transport system substrate-binding protein